MLSGCYFGDWDKPNNLLRSLLATEHYGLISLWGINDRRWRLQPLAIGGTFGDGLWETIHNTDQYPNNTAPSTFTIQGDPTLRAFVVAPPSNLTLTPTGPGITARWDPSAESGAQYHVYRCTGSMDGSFSRLTIDNPTEMCSFYDANPPPELKYYQVRAVLKVNTGCGSFVNSSQGIFRSIN